jgi:hypothetical protein
VTITQQIKAVFEKLDRDGSGYLDKMEIIIGLKDMNHPAPRLGRIALDVLMLVVLTFMEISSP